MNATPLDTALITAFFRIAGERGWRHATVVEAAREAGLSLAAARATFPSRTSVLLRFGRLADEAALEAAPAEGSVRDRLFDLLMRRFDALQAHRGGVIALLHALPRDPGLAVLLACATRRSMRWMLQAGGVTGTGLVGELQVRGLVAVWLWALRAWEHDESEDLSATMSALDTALSRADQAASWLAGRRPGRSEAVPDVAPPEDIPPPVAVGEI